MNHVYNNDLTLTASLYINNVTVATKIISYTAFTPGKFYIGHRTDGTDSYFSGYIDQFRFFTGPLNSLDVKYLYNAGIGL